MTEDAGPRRVCVVTGGVHGIGGAVSRRLAADGDRVVVVDLDESADVVGDVTDPSTVARLVEVVDGLGRLDVLVNNVGDFRPASKTFLDSTPGQWQRLYELNLGHVLSVTHALLPRMVAQGHGAIVNNSTVEAFRGIPGHAVYSGFNAAVSAFTKSLAVEVGRHGVRVNAIAPDLADTDQTPAAAMLRGRDPASVPLWVPLGRFGRPEDYAEVVAFLASDAARFVTGQTLPVDGGTLAASGWYAREDGKGWTNMPDHP
ncbi:SDR family NAD(P)-dependent oxidoreductase [Nocardioides sp.]|uniref:SDR family NAD(P)-dependent oxidoreductase n=1 Tax=Nocardioides sp. TaxID=35761 RepID=UPI001A303B22|nr:SDR family NAD(P)-dependent oxidoreductase [Nocardioides sp.]MBJ7358521.1 SDR family oxidoreductase [Nocardioides sp.]